ncbi:nucleoside-diphosphate sugar epimerase/dehydratase [Sulfurimonas sp.]|uniref:polysaccharide biosynthesis protein n=1 Tax=Sulfurimonas sp. TaxID=2022749 RepID=UPI0025D33A59|nr:nucleoside-diphosphate sugar epimerase/dehydratase [Sulfurimonas sp.]MDD5157205.1 nucleoside-diphosphate sugar epimerase/dehydratase [Sulfurimonas sp.]
MNIDKKILNILAIIALSSITFLWTFFIFHIQVDLIVIFSVISIRLMASFLIFNDYSLSWSKASQKTFLTKSFVYIVAFLISVPLFYTKITIAFLASELFLYLFSINFAMYFYHYLINKSNVIKTKSVVIYGAGNDGIKLSYELANSEYKIKFFIDDDKALQNRSIDSIPILSREKFKEKTVNKKVDLLAIATTHKDKTKEIYDDLRNLFLEIKILSSADNILEDGRLQSELKNISIEDLLARYPKDLDKEKIALFIKEKVVLVTGAGGSIGREICKQLQRYGARKIVAIDNSEYNLYALLEEIKGVECVGIMQNVVNRDILENSFKTHRPQIVIHAAAYKHVSLVEDNIQESIINNVIGTKNIIDLSIKYNTEKFVLISTDKAVRPTSIMGATKRICELYAQNAVSSENSPVYEEKNKTEIVSVRFGNVLGSSGSVIPKFKSQIENGNNITVTHPDVTRFFMLISEACELVLQAASIGKGGEIFILDMGDSVKIVDLAKKMIELSNKENIKIEFIGLRSGEKLFEELLVDEADYTTEYNSITVAKPTKYNICKLNADIEELLCIDNKLKKLKEIVPEFNHFVN